MKKILFSNKYGLTREVLELLKDMTRRVIPQKSIDYILGDFRNEYYEKTFDYLDDKECIEHYYFVEYPEKLPYRIGEVVAVAQSYHELAQIIAERDGKRMDCLYDKYVLARKMGHICDTDAGWDNKMYVRADLMPYQIRITNIRIERLQDISDEDCLREGVRKSYIGYYVPGIKCKNWEKESHVDTEDFHTWKLFPTARKTFAVLIDKVSRKKIWDKNPWVFVYEFELSDKKQKKNERK